MDPVYTPGRVAQSLDRRPRRVKRTRGRSAHAPDRGRCALLRWQLCPSSYPLARARLERAAERESAGRGGITEGRVLAAAGGLLLLFLLGWTAFRVLDHRGALDTFDDPPGHPSFSEDVFSTWMIPGIASLALLFWGWRASRRGRSAGRLRREGTPMNARIRGIEETGTSVGGQEVWKIELTLLPEGGPPQDASTRLLLDARTAERLTAGTIVRVRVDGEDPPRVVLETLP